MEDLEKALSREHLKINPNQVKRAFANDLNDIKSIIHEFDPERNKPHRPVSLNTTINVQDKESVLAYKVSSSTKSESRRDRIINGLDIIKNRINMIDSIPIADDIVVNGRVMCPPPITNVDCVSSVDLLIRDWFGAYRDGILICWDLKDGFTYKYDIYNHKLTRLRKEKNDR